MDCHGFLITQCYLNLRQAQLVGWLVLCFGSLVETKGIGFIVRRQLWACVGPTQTFKILRFSSFNLMEGVLAYLLPELKNS